MRLSTNLLRLATLLHEDWVAHGRDWTRPGLRAVAVHRFGSWKDKIPFRLMRAPLSVVHGLMFRHVRNYYGIELPGSVKLGRRVVFEHQGAVIVHGAAEIGDDCIVRQGVTIGNRRLDRPNDAPRIGNRVNIGAGAKILGGITIGDDVSVGANAVVVRDVPAAATVVGIPAQVVGTQHSSELRSRQADK
jgi:serine O-acetyltransferase